MQCPSGYSHITFWELLLMAAAMFLLVPLLSFFSAVRFGKGKKQGKIGQVNY